MVICLYNPSSKKGQIILHGHAAYVLNIKMKNTVCGVVRNIGRDMESSKILTLGQLKEYNADISLLQYLSVINQLSGWVKNGNTEGI